MNLDQYHEMDTFDICVEGRDIEAAIAPMSDFSFRPEEMVDAEHISSAELTGILHHYRYVIREILISEGDTRFIEIVYETTDDYIFDGWPETFSEVYKMGDLLEWTVSSMIKDESNYVIHNWRKEGF